jgi:hypothetical protein
MPRFYPHSKIGFTAQIKVDLQSTDTPQIHFIYKITNRGEEKTLTPTRLGLGLYFIELVPGEAGNLFFRWDTEGSLDTAKEGVINIAPSAFESAA